MSYTAWHCARDGTTGTLLKLILFGWLGTAFCTHRSVAADWPQLQNGPGHAGYTSDQPIPPFHVKWTRSLGEPTHTGSPPIVADGKIFVGTAWGNLLALDRESGKTVWSYPTGVPIVSTPAFDAGVVFVTSMDHQCHAVDATSGRRRWVFETAEGIWAGPVVADGKVFIAGRDAMAYALELAGGRVLWRTPVGAMVMSTPAYDAGVLYVGAGDNRVYALDGVTGREIWKSDPLPGAAIREYWLVAAHGTVIATTQLVNGSHASCAIIERAIMEPFGQANNGRMLVQDQLIEQLRDWYRQHPQQKVFHVLDAHSGKERFIAPVVAVHGGGCTGPLPAVGPEAAAYLIYANVRLQASGWAFPGRLDLVSGKLDPLIKNRYWIDANRWEWQPKPGTQFTRRSTFDVGFCVTDQSWGISRAGDLLLLVRDPGWCNTTGGAYTCIDLKTGHDQHLAADQRAIDAAQRNGAFGMAFHATCSPMVVSGKNIFHKAVRNVIICFEGQ